MGAGNSKGTLSFHNPSPKAFLFTYRKEYILMKNFKSKQSIEEKIHEVVLGQCDYLSDMIKDSLYCALDYYDFKGIKLSPIEKLFIVGFEALKIYNKIDKVAVIGDYSLEHNKKIVVNNKTYYIDFIISDEKGNDFKIAIELDGYIWHGTDAEQFDRDKKRERALQSIGYKVVRFSGKEIYKDIQEVMSELDIIYHHRYNELEKEKKNNGKT